MPTLTNLWLDAEQGIPKLRLRNDLDFLSDAVFIKEGGFGKVYKSMRHFAIKQIKLDSPECAFNEAAILNKLINCPFVVKIIGYQINTTQLPLIILEFCKGRNFHDFIERGCHAETSRSQKVNLLLDMSKGFMYLHKEKILHRDIKSTNIMIVYDLDRSALYQNLRIKLIDFGLSTMVTGETITNEKLFSMIRPELVQRLYKAPESLFHQCLYSTESEIYSFGFIIYKMFVGKIRNDFCIVKVDEHNHAELLEFFHKSLTFYPNTRWSFDFSWMIINSTEYVSTVRLQFRHILEKLETMRGYCNEYDSVSSNDSREHHHESLQKVDNNSGNSVQSEHFRQMLHLTQELTRGLLNEALARPLENAINTGNASILLPQVTRALDVPATGGPRIFLHSRQRSCSSACNNGIKRDAAVQLKPVGLRVDKSKIVHASEWRCSNGCLNSINAEVVAIAVRGRSVGQRSRSSTTTR